MLVHPELERHRLVAACGRLLVETFGVAGRVLDDPRRPGRQWQIYRFFAPIQARRIGGVRAMCVDAKGFVSFINQRDLEHLLGLGEPTTHCKWLGSDYVEPADRRWHGFTADDEDLEDDLYMRELELRRQQHEQTGSWLLPQNLEIRRRVTVDAGGDVEELLTLLRGDCDPETGTSPDTRFETVWLRWFRIEREVVSWRRL